MSCLRQYERVRIRRLLKPAKTYDGWGVNQRPPRVGDVGFLIDILERPGVPASYVVECSGPDGVTIWMGDLTEDEIEPISE